MPSIRNKPIDIGQHHRQTDARLILGGFTILAGLGGLVMWVLFGPIFAVLGVVTIIGGLLVFTLLWLVLKLIESWAKSD